MKETKRVLKNRIMVGAVAVSAALVPIAGVSALSAGPASAAKTKTITCTKGSGNINTKIQLTGCNGNTGTKTMKLSALLLASGGTVTWANGKTTSFGQPTLGTGTHCTAKSSTAGDETATGPVTADTTKSAKPIPGVFSGEVCLTTAGKFSLPAGHPFTTN
jgi:hypothetical protein